MQLEWLVTYFANSPVIRLLRADHAPYILDFLHQEFKLHGAVSRSQSELLSALRQYQEQIHETQPELMASPAEHYLTAWSTGESRWIRRYLESGRDEPLFELSAHTEDVIKFLEMIRARESSFIGTESRLKRIIDTLHDLSVNASSDSTFRLKHLRDERDRIDTEMNRIAESGTAPVYAPTTLRERFSDAIHDLIQLQGDFRAVEDAFKEITRAVQRMQVHANRSRGEILGSALDAEDGLQGQDQGISFNEFTKLIYSPSKQEQLEQAIERLQQIDILAHNRDGMRRIRDMIPALTAEARKVLRTYQRLSATLRRLLDRHSRTERQRLAEVLADLRQLVARMAERGQRDCVTLTLDEQPEIMLPLERPFWTPEVPFSEIALAEHQTDPRERRTAFADLAMYRSINWNRLRLSIRTALRDRTAITLPELIECLAPGMPDLPTVDAVEVLGLIQIAHDEGHAVDLAHTDTIAVQRGSATRPSWLQIPRITYLRSACADIVPTTEP
jgi:Protein of unknown function (DUF3375)